MILKSYAISAITSLGNSGAYDYIVMGTKGASGLKEVFMGSVASGVMSKTNAPVIVVPDTYRFRPLKEIVFAVSGMPFSNSIVVKPLRKIVQMFSCKINVLHIIEDKKLDLEEVLNPIKDLEPSVTYTDGVGNINQRLNEYLSKTNASLLCLIRSKKDFFSRLFDVSVTLKQTFHSPVPLLILHD